MDLRVCISEFRARSTDFKGSGAERVAGVMLMTFTITFPESSADITFVDAHSILYFLI